jgi:hypothetical protein
MDGNQRPPRSGIVLIVIGLMVLAVVAAMQVLVG